MNEQHQSVHSSNHHLSDLEAKLQKLVVAKTSSHPLHSAIKTVGSAAAVGTDPGVASVVTASKGPAAVAVVARSILLWALGFPSIKPTELWHIYIPLHSRLTVEITYELASCPVSETLLHVQKVTLLLRRSPSMVVVKVPVARLHDSNHGSLGSPRVFRQSAGVTAGQVCVTNPSWLGQMRSVLQPGMASIIVLPCPPQTQ